LLTCAVGRRFAARAAGAQEQQSETQS